MASVTGISTASIILICLVSVGFCSYEQGRLKNGNDAVGLSLGRKGRDVVIASFSAGNDDVIGTMIANSIESSSSSKTTVDVEEGMEIDSGYISPYFMTDLDNKIAEYENARVLVTDQTISSNKELLPLMEKVMTLNAPLLIIAEDVTGEALATLVVNNIRGIFRSVAIKATGSALLQDIASLTGATYLASDLGLLVENVSIEQLGKAKKITVRKESTTIVGIVDCRRIKAWGACLLFCTNESKHRGFEFEPLRHARLLL